MSEFNETRVREIVRDEVSVMHIPERLAVIEEQNREIRFTLNRIDNQKADKSDVETLKIQIGTVKGEVGSLRNEIRNNFKFIIGFFLTILACIIAIAFKS